MYYLLFICPMSASLIHEVYTNGESYSLFWSLFHLVLVLVNVAVPNCINKGGEEEAWDGTGSPLLVSQNQPLIVWLIIKKLWRHVMLSQRNVTVRVPTECNCVVGRTAVHGYATYCVPSWQCWRSWYFRFVTKGIRRWTRLHCWNVDNEWSRGRGHVEWHSSQNKSKWPVCSSINRSSVTERDYRQSQKWFLVCTL